MQPPNLGIDPAVNLWSSNSPSMSNAFSGVSPSDRSGSNNVGNDKMGDMNSSSYQPREFGSNLTGKPAGGSTDMAPPPQPSQGPQFTPDTTPANSSGFGGSETNAGEVFMGVSSPTPGGVPAWKWNANAFK